MRVGIKLTKNEQKKQKDSLKQFQRYLPTLLLKKKQLQSFIRSLEDDVKELENQLSLKELSLDSWVSVWSENINLTTIKLEDVIKPDEIKCYKENIAGVTVPSFEKLSFKDIDYSVSDTPLWFDSAVVFLKEIVELKAKKTVLKRRFELLNKELRTTSQRINLFEKVKIPETKNNIKKISVALGDASTSAVVRGKIAKKKLKLKGDAA